jgi:hypothetical protein
MRGSGADGWVTTLNAITIMIFAAMIIFIFRAIVFHKVEIDPIQNNAKNVIPKFRSIF